MPLIAKQTTTQELYKARRQREDEERDALLPPGLINHGNTCFMNSVLQGLIATPILSDIVRFNLPESQLPIASRRSPQLTNGHGHGGADEHEWEPGMPLGDVFTKVMEKAWRLQEERARVSTSPKEILSVLGSKYDQYQDFRQQDAHELLRHLLDAMRMEEWDIIKKRQPPPPKTKRRKRKKDSEHSTSAQGSAPPGPTIPKDQRLTSFVDMVFGGQLASILVCDKCKKVSCIYEDFNDLSLPIKPEDYEKVRKRDKLFGLAKKFKRRSGLEISVNDSPGPRASSVPVSPTRKSVDVDKTFGQAMTSDAEPRRRSLEFTDSNAVIVNAEDSEGAGTDPQTSGTSTNKDEEMVIVSKPGRESPKEPEEKKRDKLVKNKEKEKEGDDTWVKLSRRISVGMGMSKRDKEKNRQVLNAERESRGRNLAPKSDTSAGSVVDIKSPIPKSPRIQDLSAVTTSTASDASSATTAGTRSFGLPQRLSPGILSPPTSRSASPIRAALGRRDSSPTKSSSKPPKPPREEAAYLRRLLADIQPSHSVPFSMFRPPGATGSEPSIAQTLWAKSNVNSVDDCLRMFTAVEALDGENMVGCRRCWKIENGEYNPRGRSMEIEKVIGGAEEEEEDDGSSDSSEDGEEKRKGNDPSMPPSPNLRGLISPSAVLVDPHTGTFIQVDDFSSASGDDRPKSANSSSLPDSLQPSGEPSPSVSPLVTTDPLPTYGGLPIPLISTTAPEPVTVPVIQSHPPGAALNGLVEKLREKQAQASLGSSPSKDSLTLPQVRHVRRPAERRAHHPFGGENGIADSEESSDEPESDGSATTSLASVASSVTSLRASMAPVESDRQPRTSGKSEVPRSKQVIFRRHYKRYLVASPPPVLVVHLKRFQQVGKSPFQSFANFKKLDDFVSFPEYLDLKPFLLPKKDDYGLGKKRAADKSSTAGKHDRDEKCMYRLYAVVVHIGNMLGGHYIAYTALPDSQPESTTTSKTTAAAAASTTITTTTASITSPIESTDTSTAPTPTVVRPPTSRTTSFQNSAEIKGKKNQSARRWCYISDTVVKLTNLEEVLKAKAYICMYERI
ncbi:cysteine proteinase [Rickenella mellea]|uniref:ubiquitinyl hydrolase 1 n=1 Tax=Rickenella mellea TaxID=50990 RepID=A0A4Y7PYI7_9AGAM|nr:cysteine proteinase [Rickenella mellea]